MILDGHAVMIRSELALLLLPLVLFGFNYWLFRFIVLYLSHELACLVSRHANHIEGLTTHHHRGISS